jgi:signal transduction histidine kinase/ligand-binding sensor domain-containing protein
MPLRSLRLPFLPLLVMILVAGLWVEAPVAAGRASAEPAGGQSSPAARNLNQPQPTASVPLDRPLRFDRYSLADGLSQNSVMALLQDHQGFIWIATQEGLDRYDGYNFTVFKHDPQNANSLSLSSILSLFEDREGLLWIGTWGGGLNSYDPSTGQFIRYQHDPARPASLGGDIVTSILEDSHGRLWVGTCGGGLNLLDRKTGAFTRYLHNPADPSSLSSDYVSQVFETTSQGLLVGTGCLGNLGLGLNQLDILSYSLQDVPTGQFVHFGNDTSRPDSLSSNNISAITEDVSGAVWIGTGGYTLTGSGLNRMDPHTGQITRYQHDPNDPASLSSDNVMGLLVDTSGILWVSTWGGGLELAAVNLGSSSPLRFSHQRNNPYNSQSLSIDITWGLLQDRSGVFWIGTADGGLNKVNPDVQRFGLYRNDPSDPKSLSFNAVGPVLEDSQGRIWVSTLGGGLERFDRQTETFTHYVQPDTNPLSQQANTYIDIYEDLSGTLWTGTLAGLGRFDPISGQTTYFRNDPTNPDSLVSDNVSSIVEDQAGRLWVGTLAGLDWFDRSAGRFVHLQIPELVSVLRLYLDQDNVMWVGSWGQGLFKLDLSSLSGTQVTYMHFANDPANPASLADNGVIDILRDRAGTLWLGTQAGLDRFDPATGTFTHFQEQNGLVSNTAVCMLEDQQGNLWISTGGGISRFNPQTASFRNFYMQDGLQSNEFDSGACARTRTGEMYFGGQKGLNVFRPETIQDNPVAPPVVVTSFSVFNQPVHADLSGKTPIQLSYSEDFIAFEFVALDFHAPSRNQYAYKLDGFDAGWVEAGTRRYASYTNLPGGNYVFRVKASNNNGVWNDAGIALPVHITPPLWQNWWFQAASLLALLSLLALGVLWRSQSIRTQNRRLEELVANRTSELSQSNVQLQKAIRELEKAEAALAQKAADEAVAADRTRLARDLHDAVTQTLFSASLLADVIPQLMETNATEALKRLGELKELTRGALAEMRTLLLELRPSALTETALPDLLRQLVEAVIGRARLPVELTIDGVCCIPPEVQVVFYRIAQEALNNIVKYAKASKVVVGLRLQEDGLRLSVMDDGVGFDISAVPPNHLGLRIMRERAEAIGAKLSLYSHSGEGTQVTVTWNKPPGN